jgi:hypothetical protein
LYEELRQDTLLMKAVKRRDSERLGVFGVAQSEKIQRHFITHLLVSCLVACDS